jgi:hypothetical protein
VIPGGTHLVERCSMYCVDVGGSRRHGAAEPRRQTQRDGRAQAGGVVVTLMDVLSRSMR